MNKALLIEMISTKAGITKADAGRTLGAFMEVVTEQLSEGNPITIPGFGTFSVSHRAERQGRNPITGNTITIKAKRVPKFKAGKDLKEAVG